MIRSRPSLHQARCACSDCGAHTVALVGRCLVSGTCPCCGGQDLVRIGPLQALGDRWTGSLRDLGTERLV